MFAVSANASALRCAPAPASRASRASARPVAQRPRTIATARVVPNATAALALSAAVAFSSPGAAVAGLNKMGKQDAYAAMMAEMEAQRKAEGIKSLSVDSMYEEQGGACGEGYELVTVKVLGASCVCVSDSCKDGAKPEGARDVRTDAERSFGKANTEEESAPAGDSGIKFVFTPKE